MELSEDQNTAREDIARWKDSSEKSLRFGGLAGTGKTTIIATLPEYLGGPVSFFAPTGKAARVLSRKLGTEVKTLHSLLYTPITRHCRVCPANDGESPCHAASTDACGCSLTWVDNLTPGSMALYVIDESSMIDEYLYRDILLKASGQVLFVGDHGQLPPVSKYKTDFNLMKDPDIRLEKIHRQAGDSPILRLATMARKDGNIPFGEYSPLVRKIPLKSDEAKTINFDPDDDTLLLCYKNETRTIYNALIRNKLGFTDPRPMVGDKLICLRNDWRVGIHNGMLGTLVEIDYDAGPDSYWAEIDLEDEGHFSGLITAPQFGQRGALLAPGVAQFDFGYCITVHKAQGSQARRIILIEENMRWTGLDNWKRWLYTAVTRAEEELLILG